MRVTEPSIKELLHLINHFASYFESNGFHISFVKNSIHATFLQTNTDLFFVFREHGYDTKKFTIWLVSNPFDYGTHQWGATPSATLFERLPLIVEQAIRVARAKAILDQREQKRAQIREAEAALRLIAETAEKNRVAESGAFLILARKWCDLHALKTFRAKFEQETPDERQHLLDKLDRTIADLNLELDTGYESIFVSVTR